MINWTVIRASLMFGVPAAIATILAYLCTIHMDLYSKAVIFGFFCFFGVLTKLASHGLIGAVTDALRHDDEL